MIRAAGWALMIVGLCIFAIPGPLGWPGLPIAAIGTILLLKHSHWARRRFVRLSRTHPSTAGRYRRFISGKG